MSEWLIYSLSMLIVLFVMGFVGGSTAYIIRSALTRRRGFKKEIEPRPELGEKIWDYFTPPAKPIKEKST